MAGRKQHFIPQSLLRGFGVRRGKSTFVVAYTYGRGVFTPATDGIAAERHFYSRLGMVGEDETLDERITHHETPLAAVLSKLRLLGDNEPTGSREAAELVTHLAVRNDHFRKAMTSASTRLVDLMSDQVSDTGSARALLGLDHDLPGNILAKQLNDSFEQYRPLIELLGMDRAAFERWAFENMKSNFAVMYEEIKKPVNDAIVELAEKMPETAAGAQRKALANDLVPPGRAEALAAFSWRVVHSAEPLILPDCVALGFDTSGNGLPLMIIDQGALHRVVMPIAVDRLLVGVNGTSEELPIKLNAIMAGCSWELFLARNQTEELDRLHGTLRRLIAPYLDKIVDAAVADTLCDQLSRSLTAAPAPSAVHPPAVRSAGTPAARRGRPPASA